MFVLPRSPLPAPPAPVAKSRGRNAANLAADDGPILLTDPPRRASPPPGDELEPDAEIEWIDPDAPSTPPGHVDILDIDIPMEPGSDTEPEPALAPDSKAAATAPAGTPAHRGAKPRPKAKPAADGAAQQAASFAGRPRRRHAAASGTVANAPSAPPLIEVADQITLREWVVQHRHLLIICAVIVLVAGTVAYRVRQQRREQLPAIIEIGRIEGLPALDRGEFDVARRKLAAAARAVEALGGAYEGSETILQAAREADIFVDLVPRSFEDLVDEAALEDDEHAWQKRFNALYKGRSVLLDDNAADYRILASSGLKGSRVGRIDTTTCRLLAGVKSQPGESEHVYGARLAGLAFDEKEGVWVITLELESGVVMTHWDALKAFDWEGLNSEPQPREREEAP
jgi:hypothetical protein